MTEFRVLLPQSIDDEGISLMEDNGCSIVIPDNEKEETLKKAVVGCDAILVRTTLITRAIIESAPKLKIIARHGVGLDNVDIYAATQNQVFVCNSPTANVESVAEHVVALMVNLSHHVLKSDKAIRQGKFEVRNSFIGTEMKNKTLGLIGLGNIGKLVSQKCARGFGMKVLAYDPYVSKIEQNYIQLVSNLDELLSKSDYISLHVPYLKDLHHLIDEEKISKMKQNAYFINAARGGLVDENALYNALSEGRIAGAGIDCFEEEPVLGNHPLFELDNVVLTPHMAAHTKEAMVRMATEPAKEILRVKNNERLNYSVN